MGQGREAAKSFLENNPDVYEEVKTKVRDELRPIASSDEDE